MAGKFRKRKGWFAILSLLMAVWIFAGGQVVSAAAVTPGAGEGQEETEGKDPGTEGKDSETEGKDPSTEGKDPGTEGKDPSTEGKDPGTEGKDPGTEEKDPSTEEKDPGTEGKDPSTEGKDPGTEGKDPSTEGKDPGTEGKDPSTEGKDPGTVENTVEVQFCGKDGKVYDGLTKKVAPGSSLVFPAVPSWEGKKNSGWKLEKDGPDVDGFVFKEGDSLQIIQGDSLWDYVQEGKLNFYAVEPYTLTFWNNSGTGSFSRMDIFPGEEISLPDFPNSKYVNFGWTSVKGGTEVQYGIGESYTVKKSADLYMIRYSQSKLMTVSFFAKSGATNAAFKALGTRVLKGTKLTLPEVPVTAGYTNLGWSAKKNASRAQYLPGDQITVKKNLNLYAVRKKLTVYKVTFNNNAGTSTSKTYQALGKKVYKGKYIVLPAVPAARGMNGLGWTNVRKGKKVKYKAGDQIKVTGNLAFYAVTEKITYYTVTFCDSGGGQGSGFASLQKKVASGTELQLPAVPQKKNYAGAGWSLQKNSQAVTYQPGAKVKIKKNLTLYAVYKAAVTITLCENDGTLYKSIEVGKGEYFTLPAVLNEKRHTMMGWSSVKGKTADPEYEVGESLRVISSRTFYKVIYDRNSEQDYALTSLPAPNLSKYRKVIFVGDSRTERMALTLNASGTLPFLKKVSFVAKGGEGLAWLKTEGHTKLIQELEGEKRGSVAVVFNMGINDLYNMENYISYFRSIAGELMGRGCRLFYMSLNPINSENLKATGRGERKEETVRTFNSVIRSDLCSGSGAAYTYIDVYSYLMKNGYGTDSGAKGKNSGVDDGLHYTVKTYKRIYKFCMDFLNGL